MSALLLGYVVFFGGIQDGDTAQRLSWYASAVTITGVAGATIALGAIFLYGNREKQLKVVAAALMIALLFMIVLFGGLFLSGEYALLTGPEELGRLVVLLLPVVAYILLHAGRKAIRKDINLVKSMDRLR